MRSYSATTVLYYVQNINPNRKEKAMTEKSVSYLIATKDFRPNTIEEFVRDERKYQKQKVKHKGIIPTVDLIADICERILIIEKGTK